MARACTLRREAGSAARLAAGRHLIDVRDERAVTVPRARHDLNELADILIGGERGVRVANRHPHRLEQKLGRELAHRDGPGRGEHQRLAFRRELADDLADLRRHPAWNEGG